MFTCQSFFRVIVFYVSIVFFASIVFCLPVKVLAMRSLTILFRHVDKFLRRVSLSFSVLNFRICVKFSYNILKPQKMFLANLKNFYVCNFFSKQFRTEGSQDYIMAAKMIFLNMVWSLKKKILGNHLFRSGQTCYDSSWDVPVFFLLQKIFVFLKIGKYQHSCSNDV